MNKQRKEAIMTEELVAIPKSEYEDLLQCKQRLEEIVQERIHQLDSQIVRMKYQQQVNDAVPAIGRYTEPLGEEFARLSAENTAAMCEHYVELKRKETENE